MKEPSMPQKEPKMRVEGEQRDDAPKAPKSEKDRLLAEARAGWEEFGKTHEHTINAYFGTPDVPFTMKPGGWYIQLEGNVSVNADPTFFLEKGYSESEALFATFHEAEHFRDMIQDQSSYQLLFHRIKRAKDVHETYPSALQRLYNCIDDVLVNRVVMNRWKAGEQVRDGLYQKLFSTNDFTSQPRHRQLMYALLREAMLPDEPCLVSQEVRAAIDEQGCGNATSEACTVLRRGKARHVAKHRYAYIEHLIEPIFEDFYRQDLKDWKPPEDQDGKKGKSGSGEEERKRKRKGENEDDESDEDDGEDGENGEPGDPFGDDPFDDAIPDPIDFQDASEMAKKINEELSKRKEKEFEDLMGVSKEDFDLYREDFRVVEKYIDELSRVFDAVIQRRKTYRRVLRKRTKEGPMLDPRTTAIGVAEIKAGKTDPKIFLDYEKKEVVRNQPSRIEFTLVCDGSGSMSGDNARQTMQRQLTVLALEAFAEFQKRLEDERTRGERIQLDVLSEVRIFSDKDQVVKPLSDELTHEDRVRVRKSLDDLPGGANNEVESFHAIDGEQMTPDRVRDLQHGDVKKIILFTTDGETDSGAIQQEIKRMHGKVENPRTKEDHLVIAGIGFAGGKSAKQTYAPHGYYAEEFSDVPQIFSRFIEQMLEDA